MIVILMNAIFITWMLYIYSQQVFLLLIKCYLSLFIWNKIKLFWKLNHLFIWNKIKFLAYWWMLSVFVLLVTWISFWLSFASILVKWLFEYRFDSNRFIFNLVYIEWWIPRKMLWIPPHLIMGGRKQKLLGISQLKTLWKHVWSKFPRENVLVRALQKKGWKNIRVRFHNLTGLKYEKAQLKNRYDSLRKD